MYSIIQDSMYIRVLLLLQKKNILLVYTLSSHKTVAFHIVVSCWYSSLKSTGHHVCTSGGGRGCSFVSLFRGFVARRSHLISTLITSGSVLSGLPQSSMLMRILQFSYYESLLQRWFRCAAGQ